MGYIRQHPTVFSSFFIQANYQNARALHATLSDRLLTVYCKLDLRQKHARAL